MPKASSTIFVCTHCDSQFSKWSGRCSECGQWGTLVEQARGVTAPKKGPGPKGRASIALHEIAAKGLDRIMTGMDELDRVLGGGLVPGTLWLLGGDPGIGKSTLVLQAANALVNRQLKVLYVSGEESAAQIALRARRIAPKGLAIDFLSETNVETIIATLQTDQPTVAIIDSIQTMSSADAPSEAGSIQQVRAVTAKLMAAAKERNTVILLIGHVTKEGAMAGPKALEHLVDVVMYLEGDQLSAHRLLRTVKNRFGSTNEVAIFDMRDDGLHQVPDPSKLFLAERQVAAGAAVSVVMEGSRPFVIEIQALTSPTVFGMPRRTTSGIDLNRLHVLLAVLSRRGGLKLGAQDVFVNVVGGLKIQERSIDLAVCLAVASSLRDIPMPTDMAAVGEIGLGGEVRSVPQLERRLQELQHTGFKRVIVPTSAKVRPVAGVTLVPVSKLTDALNMLGRAKA